MTKEEIEDLEEIKSYFKYTCDNNIEYFIKVIDQLQKENEKLKKDIEVYRKGIEILDGAK